jgi:hypothetical protein
MFLHSVLRVSDRQVQQAGSAVSTRQPVATVTARAGRPQQAAGVRRVRKQVSALMSTDCGCLHACSVISVLPNQNL